jgi:hypothetical protein
VYRAAKYAHHTFVIDNQRHFIRFRSVRLGVRLRLGVGVGVELGERESMDL